MSLYRSALPWSHTRVRRCKSGCPVQAICRLQLVQFLVPPCVSPRSIPCQNACVPRCCQIAKREIRLAPLRRELHHIVHMSTQPFLYPTSHPKTLLSQRQLPGSNSNLSQCQTAIVRRHPPVHEHRESGTAQLPHCTSQQHDILKYATA
jgi:hypothetical protein